MSWRITDPRHLLGALRVALVQGGEFLVSRLAPNGPILRERNVSYMHKASWGMHAAGVDHDTLARMLDWVQREALQPSGDFYFPEERPEYKDMQRVYRAATFGKVAAWIGHPVIRQARVLDRILRERVVARRGVHDVDCVLMHSVVDWPREPMHERSSRTVRRHAVIAP